MKRDEYAKLDTKNPNDIPIYTATLNPVAYFEAKSIKRIPTNASEEEPHISFASDGDGTAGTNIIFHTCPYYINTSRLSFKIIDSNIYPEYIYYAIQDIKKKYGFDYKYKATLANIDKIEIPIPITDTGELDLLKQIDFANKSKIIMKLKKELSEQYEKISLTKIKIG